MNKINVAVVGYGQIGPVHVRSYKKIEDKVNVVAVVDKNIERAKMAQEQYGIKNIYTDYKELFKMKDLDVIDVCIPTYAHRDLVVEGARSGKHIFCEKPMAMTIDETNEMECECKKAGVKLQLGFCRRFDNQWLKFKDIVTGGLLGRPIVWRTASAGAGAPNPWFFQRDMGGGPFVDGAVHNYDFGNFMFGKVKCIKAGGTTLQSNRSAIDTGIAEILYETGDILQMMWSWGLKSGVRGGGLHDVLGVDGTLLFQAPRKSESVEQNQNKGYLTVIREGGKEEAHEFTLNDMYADQAEYFVDCILNDKQPEVTALQGQESLKVALGVLKAFETGEPVFL